MKIGSLAAVGALAMVLACKTLDDVSAPLAANQSQPDAVAAKSPEGGDCSSYWARFSSEPVKQVAFPDTAVTYWRYQFFLPAGGHTGFEIKGQFPFSRYMNFNVYDQETLDPNMAKSDRQLLADPGSTNPFVDGVNRRGPKRSYTLLVVPRGQAANFPDSPNVMELPPVASGQTTQAVEIWYRVYLPDAGISIDDGLTPGSGDGALPAIRAFDANSPTRPSMPCPERNARPILSQLLSARGNLPPLPADGGVLFYSSSAHGLYANMDNQYASAQLGLGPGSEVAVMSFRAPTFPETRSGQDVALNKSDVRYWSICLGGLLTYTSACLADENARLNQDHMATVVVGPEELGAKVESAGLNFIPRGTLMTPLLIYRNLLPSPGYRGLLKPLTAGAANNPAAANSGPVPAAASPSVLDSSYLPKGRRCRRSEFIQGLAEKDPEICGVDIFYANGNLSPLNP